MKKLPLLFLLLCNTYLFTQSHTYSDPIILGYFPSWSESWAGSGQNSKLREVPSFVNYVFLSFAKPDLVYNKGSYDISQTGIQVPYDGCTLKESIKALKDKGTHVILSVGGETYWHSNTIYQNINYQMIKDLVDDMGFVGIDWDFEPNGSFSNIGSTENIQHFIDFFNNSRALMPRSEGYILACAPSGVGALGGQANDDINSTHKYDNRNALTGESDANLYNSSAQTNGINLFGLSATGHMIPVIHAVGDKIDIIAYQGYNVGGSQNRKIMYDAYAYYADIYGFKVVAGVHFPEEPWGPYYTYTHDNVADLAEHIYSHPLRAGEKDGIMIWQLLMAGGGNSAYGYMNLSSKVLSGVSKSSAIAEANNFSMETYSGGSEVNCDCDAPEPNLGNDVNICGQSSYTLNSNVAMQAGVTFTWKKDGNTVVSSSATQNTYDITDAGTYKVEVEKDGCASDDVIIVTKVADQPNLGSDASLCPNGSVTLNSNVAAANHTFKWYKNGALIPSATGNTYTATSAGTYKVEVEQTACASSSDEVEVINDMPDFDLGAPSNLCSPATRTLSTGFTNPAYQYVWKKDGNVIVGATDPSYTVTTAGTYEVIVSASGCNPQSDNVAITSSLPTGTNDTLCEAGTANLVASESVDWFDVETGGNSLHTGTTFSPNVNSSTDYWVSAGGGSQSYTTMRSAFQNDGWQQYPYVYGTKIIVNQELTLDEITVNAGGGSVTINIVEDDGTTIVESTTVQSVTGITTIPLNFALNPGTYFINPVGSSSNLLVDLTPASDYIEPGILTVEGEAYWDWNTPYGANYVKSGDYGNLINLKYTAGTLCDRVLVQAIIDPNNPKCVNNPCAGKQSYSNTTAEACEEFTWNGTTYNTSGTYTWIGTNAAGCDSIATLELTIKHKTINQMEVEVCDSYTSPSGKEWNTSGSYQDTIPNAAGCDSIMYIQLILSDLTHHNISIEACDSVLSPSGLHTWHQSGNFQDTLQTVNGCDSILSIDLIIHNTVISQTSLSSCGSIISPSGKYEWNQSGTYYDTLQTHNGCDSVLLIDVDVKPLSFESLSISHCGPYTSPSGKYHWTESGTYSDTLQNQFGCDSILEITLEVKIVDTRVINLSAVLIAQANNATFQWLDCRYGMQEIEGKTSALFAPPYTSEFAVEVTQNGCIDTSLCYYQVGPGTGPGGQTSINESGLKLNEISKVSVFNILGQKIWSGKDVQKALLPKGNYIIISEYQDGKIKRQNVFLSH